MARGRWTVEEGRVVVEGSVLFAAVRVGEGAIICDSIIGPRAVVGADDIVRLENVYGLG